MSTEVAILEKQSRTYRDYPQDQKAEALAAWEANGFNVLATAKQLGIPRQTLDYWIKDVDRYSEIQQIKRGQLGDRLEEIAYRLTDAIDEHDLSIVPLQAKATSLAIAIDKMQLLRGLPTQITATTTELKEALSAVQAIANTEHLSEYDAAIRLAAQLEDVPELASQLRAWAEEELKNRECLTPPSD